MHIAAFVVGLKANNSSVVLNAVATFAGLLLHGLLLHSFITGAASWKELTFGCSAF
jgi:hypothetical protein